VVAEARADFDTLVQALTRYNEPWPVPASMGACIVTGYNNWGRILELRRRWQGIDPDRRSPATWPARLRELAEQPQLYQDRFILLSSGPYSGVPAAALGLDEATWKRQSLTIRLEHECTHYFTSQVLGAMNNALADELIADYMGIVATGAGYRADWFLRFMGLEAFPRYREGGRMDIYRGEPRLSDGAFTVLQHAVRQAAHNLQRIDELRAALPGPALDDDGQGKARVILALARLGLEGLAAPGAAGRFADLLRQREVGPAPFGLSLPATA
jgi:hypothetical protein